LVEDLVRVRNGRDLAPNPTDGARRETQELDLAAKAPCHTSHWQPHDFASSAISRAHSPAYAGFFRQSPAYLWDRFSVPNQAVGSATRGSRTRAPASAGTTHGPSSDQPIRLTWPGEALAERAASARLGQTTTRPRRRGGRRRGKPTTANGRAWPELATGPARCKAYLAAGATGGRLPGPPGRLRSRILPMIRTLVRTLC
jgi:hypothetical protein